MAVAASAALRPIVLAINERRRGIQIVVEDADGRFSELARRQEDERKSFDSRFESFMSENDIDERQFLKSLQEQPVPGQDLPADEISPMKFPVFCTADIPAEVLDEFIKQCLADSKEAVAGTAAVAVLTTSSLFKGDHITQPPARPFESPFLGKTPAEVLDIFEKLVAPLDRNPSLWSASSFVILDEQSVRDSTCLLVSNGEGEMQTRRSDLKVAMYHLIPVEMLVLSLEQCGLVGADSRDQTLTHEMLLKEVDDQRAVARLGPTPDAH